MPAQTGRRAPVIAVLVIVAAALAAAASPTGRDALSSAVAWMRGSGALGCAVAIAAAVVGIPLGLPMLWFCALIGYLYGPVAGPPIAVAAALAGACAAFGLARALFRARVERFVAGRPRWRAVVLALGDGGPRLVVLLRLAGPHNLLNLVLAASPLTAAQFAVGTVLGSLPSVLLGSLGGAAVHDPAALWRALDELGGASIAVVVVGAVALTFAAVVLVRSTRRALARIAAEPVATPSTGP
jgi:uncharacterized membrane protein YdjX (TVP38/TMEM64 family)